MGFLNGNAPAIQAMASVVIAGLTVLLFFLNRQYVKTTERIAKASVEQSEALQKPFVTVETVPRDHFDTILSGPNAATVAQKPIVVVHNFGMGPALNVNCRFSAHVPEGGLALDHPEFVPALQPGNHWETSLPVGSLDNRTVEFSARYHGLSGCMYETKITITNRVVTAFNFGPNQPAET